jgi:glycine betaine/proline transport system permease protein
MDGMADFITAWKIPVGQWGRSFFSFLTDNFEFVFDAIADSLKFLLDSMIDGLLWLPPLVLVLASSR